MSATDSNAGVGSTHEMLLHLLASEIGLRAPQPPQAQFQQLQEAYPELKRLALTQLELEVRVPLPTSPALPFVRISGRDDGLLFAELFRGMELFVGPDTVVDDYAVKAVMAQWVFPLTGRKVEAMPDFREGVLLALTRHHAKCGPSVRRRNLACLKSHFRFSDGFLSKLT